MKVVRHFELICTLLSVCWNAVSAHAGSGYCLNGGEAGAARGGDVPGETVFAFSAPSCMTITHRKSGEISFMGGGRI